jgi:hypothetical protein
MTLTLHDITPVGLCIATQNLFDAKRFQQNFCDNMLLRARDKTLEPKIVSLKRELNSSFNQKKFLEGYKVVIVDNLDKIFSIVSSRYTLLDLRMVEGIISNGKKLIDKVLSTDNFETIASLESEFKSKITLPVYELFIKHSKQSKISIV